MATTANNNAANGRHIGKFAIYELGKITKNGSDKKKVPIACLGCNPMMSAEAEMKLKTATEAPQTPTDIRPTEINCQRTNIAKSK